MVFEMLNDLSWELVIDQLLPFLVVVVLGLAGLLLGGALGAKLLAAILFWGRWLQSGCFTFSRGTEHRYRGLPQLCGG